jgi:hypothetical protein
VQACVNGLVPLLLYSLVRRQLGERTAIIAAVLVALFSFNTVYASTEATDSLCTVAVLASLVVFERAWETGRLPLFVGSGLLAGVASQLRPNLMLFAPAMALVALTRVRRRLPALAAYVAAALVVAVPWVIRNYRLTGEFIPASTRGTTQLWYGTLQTGPYLTSQAYNPRAAFEVPTFDYTSLANRPILMTVDCSDEPQQATLTYWTDRNRTPIMIAPEPGSAFSFTVPGQPIPTTVYYYFESRRPNGAVTITPTRGASDPYIFIVDNRHLEDLDRHGDLLDAFDFVRVLRAAIWHEPLERAERFDFNRDGSIGESDLRLIAAALMPGTEHSGMSAPDVIASVSATEDRATIRFTDRSTLIVPRTGTGRITDLLPSPGYAQEITAGHRRMASMPVPAPFTFRCLPTVNDAFYQREAHMMRRYTALAWDNIERDPWSFVAASAYRAVRLFVVAGTSDSHTAQQFEGSGRVYVVAALASAVYLFAASAGIVLAIRRRASVWLLLTPIVYIPATICFGLTNMRYTITVQPLLFAFAAVAIDAMTSKQPAPGLRTEALR